MKKKLLVPVLCILMMLVGGFATWAYLTDEDANTNTFTVGNIEMTMDEEAVNEDGTATDANDPRVKENKYHLIPGHEYIKDPTIHVAADSEDCFLFVTVDNDIEAIEDPANTIHKQMTEVYGWRDLGVTKDDQTVYYLKTIVKKGTSVQDLKLFEEFKIAGNITKETLANYSTEKGTYIKVNAYAVQADGFHTANDDVVIVADALKAWNAAFGTN